MHFIISRVTVWAELFLALFSMLGSSATFTPLPPPSYPLAVRNPYLSAWLPGSLASDLPSSTPQFWAGNDLSWSVIARVDGSAYNLFGVTSAPDNTQSASVETGSYTSTHSIFTLTAGSATFTLDFFSPVSPKNYVRQSLPFSYLTISVSGTDNSSPSIQIYSDIDDTWTGQSSSSSYTLSTNDTTSLFQLSALNTATYSQSSDDQALWGEAVYATRSSDDGTLYTAAGSPDDIRSQFVSNGSLSNVQDDWTSGLVVAFAHDLGTIGSNASVTFAIGYVREEAVNYLGDAQTGYYRATYSDTASAVSHFLDDYDDANTESSSLDELIQTSGESAASSNYSDILALSVRQVFGGIDITIPNESLDTSGVLGFIKEISSDGNVNTVDVIYPTFPIFYILNPDLIKLLITPVLEYVQSGSYDEDYPPHDIGTNYPNATGHESSGESMPVEESGNILILAYAYQLGSGDTDLATTYSALFTQYAEYLEANGEYPASQLSVNDALGEIANQTNLGVKAAVGLASYGALTSQSDYTTLGKSFADTIYTDRVGTDSTGSYFTIEYGVEPWFLIFNLYADILFGLDVFPTEAYNATSVFYPTVRDTAGIPLDGDIGWGQTNWQSFVAATVDTDTRDIFISDLHAYISNGQNTQPFSDRYWVTASGSYVAGDAYAFRARPTLGSHFAVLALSGADTWSG